MRDFEREFLKLACTYLTCRLAVMGGVPLVAQHYAIKNFDSLQGPLIGMMDNLFEMRSIVAKRMTNA